MPSSHSRESESKPGQQEGLCTRRQLQPLSKKISDSKRKTKTTAMKQLGSGGYCLVRKSSGAPCRFLSSGSSEFTNRPGRSVPTGHGFSEPPLGPSGPGYVYSLAGCSTGVESHQLRTVASFFKEEEENHLNSFFYFQKGSIPFSVSIRNTP